MAFSTDLDINRDYIKIISQADDSSKSIVSETLLV
jgi:hypothetical protein